MSEAEDEGVKTVSFVFTDGEILTFRASDDRFAGNKIFNGGTHEAALLLASVVASGVVGNAAHDAVRLGVRFLKLRLHRGTEDDQRAYVGHIAHLAVAAKLDKPSAVKVVSCIHQTDRWAAVVVADGRTYRVQLPLNDPRPTAISVDLD